MTAHPADALRLVQRRVICNWIQALGFQPTTSTMTPRHIDALIDALSAAAPASPLPEGGGPTCQVCGGKIEAWTCQGCGAQFHENDAGSLVLGMATPGPADQCSGITGELDPRLVEWGYTSLDEAITHLGKLLDDQAAFYGLAAPTGDAK